MSASLMSYSPPPRAAKAVELCRNPWVFTLGATNAQRDTVKAPAKSTAETRRFEARAMDSRSCRTARPCCGGAGAKNLTEKRMSTQQDLPKTPQIIKLSKTYRMFISSRLVNTSLRCPSWNEPEIVIFIASGYRNQRTSVNMLPFSLAEETAEA